MIERNIKTIITPTPEEVAFCWCEMSSNEQARFFNEIAVLTDKWDKPFCFQLQSITDEKILTSAGRGIMDRIGEYSHIS